MKVYIGIDAHSTNYTVCTYVHETGELGNPLVLKPDIKSLMKYINEVKRRNNTDEVLCGYEAGCLGFTLYKQLLDNDVNCVVMAPSTITTIHQNKKMRRKNDKKDALALAKALGYKEYSSVNIPSDDDLQIRDYIRMRDDHKDDLKRIKQRILSLCLRSGHQYKDTSYWSQKHITWLKNIDMPIVEKEVLDEYLETYFNLVDRIEKMDKRIEEFASTNVYEEKVKRLTCLKGIKTHTALSLIVEVGDYSRFKTAEQFSAYLGLVPGLDDSSDKLSSLPITKAGNIHLRKLLTEAAQTYSRGGTQKSKLLKKRQEGNSKEVIDYADRSRIRLTKKYQRMMFRGVKYNKITTALARELTCFVWGMMTEHIY